MEEGESEGCRTYLSEFLEPLNHGCMHTSKVFGRVGCDGGEAGGKVLVGDIAEGYVESLLVEV